MNSSKLNYHKVCYGLERSKQAQCLSDLLLDAPSEWLDKPLLRFRMADGTWQQWSRKRVQQGVLRLAAWLEEQGVRAGDRVGILGHNCIEWLLADFAILRLGAVTVPAYFTDPPEAVRYVLDDAGCSLILAEEGAQAEKLTGYNKLCLLFHGENAGAGSIATIAANDAWDKPLQAAIPKRGDLATLIYTSGTTGHPKGVMLTHENLLSDVWAGLSGVPIFPDDVFLSFLPLSHAFERSIGHFLPMACGAEIAYAEDVTTLLRDMPEVKPTAMISVPRLYEKIYAGVQAKMSASAIKNMLFTHAQALGMERFALRQSGSDLSGLKAMKWKILDALVNAKLREKMGGNLRLFISGGAALSPRIANFLLAADITVLPGYGLSETSPVLTVNVESKIKPASVGPALPTVELKLESDGELLARGPMVTQGYWNLPDATAEVLDADGWFHTGDLVKMDADGYVFIVDRKKEIMVLGNGENVPPAVVEQHLMHDVCIDQAMVVGEGRPWLAALLVVNEEQLHMQWARDKLGVLPQDWRSNRQVMDWMQKRINRETVDLASYKQIRKFIMVEEEWTQENGCLTPTLKLKRRQIRALHVDDIESIYTSESSM